MECQVHAIECMHVHACACMCACMYGYVCACMCVRECMWTILRWVEAVAMRCSLSMSFEHIKSIKSLYLVHNPCALNCAIFSVFGQSSCVTIYSTHLQVHLQFFYLSSLLSIRGCPGWGRWSAHDSSRCCCCTSCSVSVLCMIWSGFCSLCCLFGIVSFHSSSVYHPLETRLSLPLFLQQCSEFVVFFSLSLVPFGPPL